MQNPGRRSIPFLLTGSVLLSLFAGCAPKKTDPPSVPDKAASSAPASETASSSVPEDEWAAWAPVPDKKYKISWTAYQDTPCDPDAKMIRYYEEMFNVDFDVWNIDYQQYDEILNIRLASGEIPDLVHIPNPANLTKYQSQDILAEIPMPILEKYMPNSLKGMEEQTPGYLDFGKIDGKLYGIAAVNLSNLLRQPIVYRQDWLDKLGLSIPTTIEEYEQVIYAFANDDPDGNGSKDTLGLSEGALKLLYGMYGAVPDQQYFKKSGDKLVFGMIEPEMKEALAYASKWYKDGVLDPEFITGENTGGDWSLSHAFISGKIGSTVHANYYHWAPPGYYKDLDAQGQEIPSLPGKNTKELLLKDANATVGFGQPLKNKDGVQGGVQGYNLLMKFYAVGANASNEKEPGKMAKILEIMDHMGGNPDLDAYGTARWGIMGEDWVWSEKERVTQVKLPPHDKQPSLRYENGNVFWWSASIPGVTPRPRREEWGYKEGFDKGGIYSEVQIATPAMAKYNAELESMRQQAYIQIITGDKPLEHFDAFVKEYLATGGQEILDEVNQWYQGTQGQ